MRKVHSYNQNLLYSSSRSIIVPILSKKLTPTMDVKQCMKKNLYEIKLFWESFQLKLNTFLLNSTGNYISEIEIKILNVLFRKKSWRMKILNPLKTSIDDKYFFRAFWKLCSSFLYFVESTSGWVNPTPDGWIGALKIASILASWSSSSVTRSKVNSFRLVHLRFCWMVSYWIYNFSTNWSNDENYFQTFLYGLNWKPEEYHNPRNYSKS